MRPWRSWIARQTPTLKAAGSNPVGRTKRRDTRISSVSSFGTISANRTTKLTDEDKNFSYKTRTKRINKIATLQLSKIIIAGRMLF